MLKVEKLNKIIGKFSLKDVDFSINPGDYFVLLGPSGSGKSLLLEIIAGLQKPDSGKIILDKCDITNEKIQKRHVGIVFQEYALFPHMSVFQNIAYPLISEKISASARKTMVEELADSLGIGYLLNRKPASLSGGEKQRVALARTLALKPLLLLLDEPLASLDVMLKSDLRKVLRNLNKNGQTIIHVTHDYEEAITLASSVGVINNGILEQTGTPEEVFRKPKSSFVAMLTGIKNFFPVNIITGDEGTSQTKTAVIPGGEEIKLSAEVRGNKGWIVVRSEDIVVAKEKHEFSSNNQLKGVVTEIIPVWNGLEIIIDAGCKWAALITPESAKRLFITEGCEVWMSFKSVAVSFITY